MPRVTTVKRAQKPQGSCGGCGKDLEKGAPYVWWAFRYGGKRKRCTASKCAPRASDLTQGKMGGVYAAQEGFEDWLGEWDGFDLDELRSELESCVDEVRQVAEEYTESAESIRETFEESPTAEECEEKAEGLESWIDDLEAAADQADEYEGELDDDDAPKDEKAADAWREAIVNEIEGALSDLPF